jgi:hypothetical protein
VQPQPRSEAELPLPSGGNITIPPSDQPQATNPESVPELTLEIPDFDPAPVYEKDIRDGGMRMLSSFVHSSDAQAPKQTPRTTEFPPAHTHDEALVEGLAKTHFTGPVYEKFADRLVRAGYKACLRWILQSAMHDKCRERRRPIGVFPGGVDAKNCDHLAQETAEEGEKLFRDVALRGNLWISIGGASLLTYYFGACIHAYPSVYRRWFGERLPKSSPYHHHDPPVSPGKINLDEATWVAITLIRRGTAPAEIAAVLGGKPAGISDSEYVESLLQRGGQRATDTVTRSGGRHG